LQEFAQQSGVGVQHLRRMFRAKTGMTPAQFARARRVEQLKSNLRDGTSVTHAMLSAGYQSSSRLYEHAGQQLGMTPGAYREGGKGANIRYDVVDCSLGKLLVATSDSGVCALKLGDSARPLVRELNEEFHAATLTRGEVPAIEQVLRLLEGRSSVGHLSLDMRGTVFQRTVWAALCAIPRGQTRSYQQLAASLGRPTAARAVARACATNPVAVIVPCHRVVRGTGELSGYRWGVARKRELLDREKQKKAT
jgi:AraC family transcriptional regulator of adaptative response/methylated-DNA-[protein]-cysteine methyltransferase